ncbi:MAG: bifunctional 4-hydroxy-2-oxoglutarate aldolase/2-dehydro-3-deoxy-phosphogluconate aldolase [Acidimicrobiales bacterium]
MTTTPAFPWEVMATIAARRAIAIVRAPDRDWGVDQCRRLIEAGARVIEVSFTTPDAAALIAELVELADRGTLIGAGTVLDESTARQAIDAGAQFLIAPSLAPDMVRTGQRHGIAVIPAAQTPTEAVAAMELGASAVKLFPAATVGIAGMAAISEALPHVPFIPTGGIDLESAELWIEAGAVAVGLGGAVARADPDKLRRRLDELAVLDSGV